MATFPATLGALRHRDFRWLWAGTLCSTGSQWIQQATLGWVVYDLTGSGALLGAVLAIRAIPMLLLSPISGLVADRLDRRRALAASQFVMFVISVLLALGLALDRIEIWHLFAFTLLSGAGMTFDRTLRSTLLLDVVPRTEIANAFALNTIAFSVMRTIGPAVAGFLIAWIGPAWNFALQGLLFLGVTMSAFMIAAPPPIPHAHVRGTAWGDIKEGLRFAVTHPVARLMVMMGLIPPLLLIPSFSALMPVFAVDVFLTGPEGLGMLLSAVGAGGVVGGVLAASASRFERVGLLQILALLAFALSLIGFALCTTIAVAVVFLAIAGAAEMVYANSQVATLQMCAPEAMRGRVASLMPVFPAFISVGALTSGIGADWLGAPAIVIVMALASVGIAGFAWTRHAELRQLRLSRLIGEQ